MRLITAALIMLLSFGAYATERECDDGGYSCWDATYKFYLRCEIHDRTFEEEKLSEVVTVFLREKKNTETLKQIEIGKRKYDFEDLSEINIGELGNNIFARVPNIYTHVFDRSTARQYRFVKLNPENESKIVLLFTLDKFTGVLTFFEDHDGPISFTKKFSGTCEKADKPKF
jgi:hypothetical protein